MPDSNSKAEVGMTCCRYDTIRKYIQVPFLGEEASYNCEHEDEQWEERQKKVIGKLGCAATHIVTA